MRKAPSASPWSKTHIMAALTLARSAPMGLDHSGSSWVFQDVSRRLHKFQEVREVSCPNRAVVRYVTQCIVRTSSWTW